MPGKQWATTPEMIKKYGLEDLIKA